MRVLLLNSRVYYMCHPTVSFREVWHATHNFLIVLDDHTCITPTKWSCTLHTLSSSKLNTCFSSSRLLSNIRILPFILPYVCLPILNWYIFVMYPSFFLLCIFVQVLSLKKIVQWWRQLLLYCCDDGDVCKVKKKINKTCCAFMSRFLCMYCRMLVLVLPYAD